MFSCVYLSTHAFLDGGRIVFFYTAIHPRYFIIRCSGMLTDAHSSSPLFNLNNMIKQITMNLYGV